MRGLAFAIVLGGLAGFPGLLPAQTGISPKRCEPPRTPIGDLKGSGRVAYRVGSNGRPDTATVIVLATQGLSAGALRSAARRALSGCRYENRDLPTPRPALLSQAIMFDSTGARLAPAHPASPDTLTALEVGVVTMPELVHDDDPALEERPRVVECRSSRAPPPPEPPTAYRDRDEAQAAMAARAQRGTGDLRARVTVGPDGKVVPGSVVVLEASNQDAVYELKRMAEGCRYAPGRIGGVPVTAEAIARVGVRVTIEIRP
ncbi:MAG TPA: hypothetical protein VGP80_02535 [Gemmatimonadales bacterium]|nr:hypothetical protein [Gemmatimonadales bacterium]